MARILIVEDDPDIALGLEDDLRLEGYEVETVSDGEAATRRGHENRWDLILLDVMLPHKDGFDVCRQLRKTGVRTPIIILTARAQETEKILGLDLGADDYITKPFSPRELRARIRAVLRRGEGTPQGIYRFGTVEVDFARCEIRRAGVSIDTTTLEFKLLGVFIRRRGIVLSRSQLIDAAWGNGTYITDRAVDTHIVNLRRKVEDKPDDPQFIVSVRGLGYRFDG